MISALLSPQGIPAKILNLALDGKVTLVYDNHIFVEYMDVLSRDKLKLNKELVNLVVDFIAKEGEYAIAELQKVQFADEDDKIFYELYKSGHADYLITGNKKHFPSEKGIVSPREFFDEYKQQ